MLKGNKQRTSDVLDPTLDASLVEFESHAAASIVPAIGTRDVFDHTNQPVWFTTEKKLTHFDMRMTWTSPNMLDSWRLIAQRVASQAKTEGGELLVDTKTTPHIYVNRCELDPTLRLFPLHHTESISIKAMQKEDREFAQLTDKFRWMGLPAHDVRAKNFANKFCQYFNRRTRDHLPYDGWRNPWDQNEIMLCRPTQLTCQGGFICNTADILKLAGFQEGKNDHQTYDIFSNFQSDEGGNKDDRFNFIVFRHKPPVILRNVSFEKRQAMDVADELFKKTCVAESSLAIKAATPATVSLGRDGSSSSIIHGGSSRASLSMDEAKSSIGPSSPKLIGSGASSGSASFNKPSSAMPSGRQSPQPQQPQHNSLQPQQHPTKPKPVLSFPPQQPAQKPTPQMVSLRMRIGSMLKELKLTQVEYDKVSAAYVNRNALLMQAAITHERSPQTMEAVILQVARQ